MGAVHRLGAAERRGLGPRRSGCWSTPGSGSSSPTAARSPSASGSTCRRAARVPATPARRPASPPARSARSAADGYDVAACHGFLDTAPGRDCLDRGCAVRRACPVGADLRPEAQSAFHMARLSWQAVGMRRLILMRHAKSSWADPSQRDLDRPLNKRGRRSAGAGRRLDEAQGLPAGAGAGLERAAHPGDLVGDRRRGRPGRDDLRCPSSTTPARTPCSRCCGGPATSPAC